MRTLLPMLVLLALSACKQKMTLTGRDVSGSYVHRQEKEVVDGWVGTEEAKLQLNADSSFVLFVHYAESCIPGEAAGNWTTSGDRITLTDTTASGVDPITLRIAGDHLFAGEYGSIDFKFNRNTK